MNWDKQSILAVILGAAALILWYTFGDNMLKKTAEPTAAPTTVQTTNTAAEPAAAKTVEPTLPAPAAAANIIAEQKTVSISGNDAVYSIQPLSGAITGVAFDKEKIKNAQGEALQLKNGNYKSSWLGVFGLNNKQGSLQTTKIVQNQKINDQEYLLVRKVRDSNGTAFTVVTAYKTLDNHRIQMDMTVVNTSDKVISVPALTISAGELEQWYRLSGDKKSNSQELHNIEYCSVTGKVKNENASADADDWQELNGKTVRWFGITNRFFAQLFSSSEPVKMLCERINLPQSKDVIVHAAAETEAFTLTPQSTPGSSKKFSFTSYIGPKQPKALRAFDSEATEVMHLGWFPIDFLAYIMLGILNYLHGFVGSFGWSIILLTLLIRTIFFPVTMKANASMREMSALSPKLKEIREKYKDEPMVAQAKMSELYKEHNVNPLGGCLPMIIQIPVFIALYYALGSASELRMQSFWWIKDLAQPDTVAHIFGLAINPLIIAWTLLMVVQQKLTPTAMDPMQAKVMLAMPLVMLFILYSLPAALTLYWTVSQIFSIAQMMYQNKLKKKADAARAAKEQEKTDKPKIVRS